MEKVTFLKESGKKIILGKYNLKIILVPSIVAIRVYFQDVARFGLFYYSHSGFYAGNFWPLL